MSPTPLQSETARVNGAKSTGPVTAEGKVISSQNSLKHGLCSKQVVLPGEDQQAFDRLKTDYARRFRPEGPAEEELVEIIANSSWRLKRIMRIEMALMTDENIDSLQTLALLIRYEAQLNRTYDRSVQRLKELQETRPEPSPDPGPRPLAPVLRNEPKLTSKPDAELAREIEKVIFAPLPGEKSNPVPRR